MLIGTGSYKSPCLDSAFSVKWAAKTVIYREKVMVRIRRFNREVKIWKKEPGGWEQNIIPPLIPVF